MKRYKTGGLCGGVRFPGAGGKDAWERIPGQEEIGKEEIGQEEIGKEEIGKEKIGKEKIGKEKIGYQSRDFFGFPTVFGPGMGSDKLQGTDRPGPGNHGRNRTGIRSPVTS